MPHLTLQQLRDAAVHHAERAHELLTEADKANAAGSPTPGQREGLRIELAEAHSHASLALSSLVLPAAAAANPPTPTAG